ncbi:uncharacterized protein LOC34618927 [Cyclospora cayetanensis]|uniref:Uncharacterized protein LOC34618927 n=1 Tax=Cyclospora cayetanensis TaxID=88456 RepID=A0A6P6RZI5_9EIME|nr:uncharacterized protein LOC34618927 [Cyclospora cayetanensis]
MNFHPNSQGQEELSGKLVSTTSYHDLASSLCGSAGSASVPRKSSGCDNMTSASAHAPCTQGSVVSNYSGKGIATAQSKSGGMSKMAQEDGRRQVDLEVLPLEVTKDSDIQCSRKPSLYLVFTLLGCNSLICWNFVIQTLPFILLQKLNRPGLNNLFLGIFQVANLVVQIVLMRLSKPRPSLVVWGSVGSGTLGLMLAAAVALMPHKDLGIIQDMDAHLRDQSASRTVAPLDYAQQCLLGVMLLLSVLMGFCQGLIQGVGYTLSCQIAPGYVASVSLGVAYTFAFYFLFRARHPDVAESLARVKHIQQEPAEASSKRLDSPLTESKERTWGFQLWGRKVSRQQSGDPNGRPNRMLWMRVAMASWKELLLAVFHFSYTYHLYPSVGPLGWNYSWTFPNQIVVLYGMWFLFETIGRASPDLGWIKGLGWLRPSRKAYAPISLSTLVFLVPFLLGYLCKPGSFFTDPIWYVFVIVGFAFCHGWIGTLAFFYACNAVDDPRERMVAGPLTVLSVGFGCVVGFLTSLAY